jgi:hypothetical protein
LERTLNRWRGSFNSQRRSVCQNSLYQLPRPDLWWIEGVFGPFSNLPSNNIAQLLLVLAFPENIIGGRSREIEGEIIQIFRCVRALSGHRHERRRWTGLRQLL